VRVALVSPDLLIASRVASSVESAGSELLRVDDPTDLPTPPPPLILVDWAYRRDSWSALLAESESRVILFGPHTDLQAHADARGAGLGPMWARSRLLSALPDLLATAQETLTN
jgi:hypothetical protein